MVIMSPQTAFFTHSPANTPFTNTYKIIMPVACGAHSTSSMFNPCTGSISSLLNVAVSFRATPCPGQSTELCLRYSYVCVIGAYANGGIIRYWSGLAVIYNC